MGRMSFFKELKLAWMLKADKIIFYPLCLAMSKFLMKLSNFIILMKYNKVKRYMIISLFFAALSIIFNVTGAITHNHIFTIIGWSCLAMQIVFSLIHIRSIKRSKYDEKFQNDVDKYNL